MEGVFVGLLARVGENDAIEVDKRGEEGMKNPSVDPLGGDFGGVGYC
jgi:hypothetical protein